jgi:hypothetical protein
MDISRVNLQEDVSDRRQELQKMPKEEALKICAREGRCFYCKEKGHMASSCPELQKRNARYLVSLKTEVQPQAVTPDAEEGVPQRQDVFNNDVAHRAEMLNCAIDASGERLECMVKVTLEHREWVEKALVDSGAMGVGYVDETWVSEHKIPRGRLENPISVRTVDGTPCGAGKITHSVKLRIGVAGVIIEVELLEIRSPLSPIILGLG